MKLRAGVLAFAAGILIAGSAVAPAEADVRLGTRVAGPQGSCRNKSLSNGHVKVCFKAYGEWLYVKDKARDGRSAYGEILVPEIKPACRNKYGKGTWVKCNYSVPEYQFVLYHGYTQDNEGWFNQKENYTGTIREEA